MFIFVAILLTVLVTLGLSSVLRNAKTAPIDDKEQAVVKRIETIISWISMREYSGIKAKSVESNISRLDQAVSQYKQLVRQRAGNNKRN